MLAARKIAKDVRCALERQQSAKSGLVAVRQLNDRTGVTLPDAKADERSLHGPFRSFLLVDWFAIL